MMKLSKEQYERLISSLDNALNVFIESGKTESEAETELMDFLAAHYFAVWRAVYTPEREQ